MLAFLNLCIYLRFDRICFVFVAAPIAFLSNNIISVKCCLFKRLTYWQCLLYVLLYCNVSWIRRNGLGSISLSLILFQNIYGDLPWLIYTQINKVSVAQYKTALTPMHMRWSDSSTAYKSSHENKHNTNSYNTLWHGLSLEKWQTRFILPPVFKTQIQFRSYTEN